MSRGSITNRSGQAECLAGENQNRFDAAFLIRILQRMSALLPCLRKIHTWATCPWREARHWILGYRFLRCKDCLIVSGGGQLDEEWGGPWGHPFALFKWAVLARLARIPYLIASVGAQKTASTTCRLFMSAALRLANYRSYRDKNSREIAAGLFMHTAKDAIVPDLVFGLPSSEIPPPAGIRSMAHGRPIIAISPIAYAKPQNWPHQDRALHDRYTEQMVEVISALLKRGCFVILIASSLGDDEGVIPELLCRLDREAQARLANQMHIPAIAGWRDFVATLLDVDSLVASRLHGTIFGFVAQKPTVAISFDPKVDWVMEDLGQTDYLLQISDFAAAHVIRALDCIELHRDAIVDRIASYRHRILSDCAQQYDALVEFIVARHRS
jgi:polysaccharide pyruvyl transferase WcaK-like protein